LALIKSLRARLGLNTPRQMIAAGVLLGLGVAIFCVVLAQNPFAVDWHFTYRPAALAMAQGKSPFAEVELFFTAPWSLIPIIPFALLPEDVGRSLWFVLSIAMFAFVAYRLGGKPVAVLAFLLSAPVANCIQTGNIEWLVLLGYVLPPQIGLIFLAMKPQSTFVAILYYVVEAWRKGGIREALRVVWPVALIGLLSLLLFGLWPLKAAQIFEPAGVFNVSIWPQGIPIGLLLAVQAFRSRKREPAMMASPFLSPYTILLSWSGAVAAFAASTVEMVTVSVGTWVFWLIFRSTIY
jgi:hypothetical protein